MTDLFGVAEPTIVNLERNGLVIRTEDGQLIDAIASVRAYVRHLREGAAGRAGKGGLTEAREAFERARTENMELKNAEMRLELVPAASVRDQFFTMCKVFRGAALAIPGKMRAKLPHLTAHDAEVMDGVCRATLKTIADEARAMGHDGAGSE